MEFKPFNTSVFENLLINLGGGGGYDVITGEVWQVKYFIMGTVTQCIL